MKSNGYLYYQQHIMWYESKLLPECLDSLLVACKNSILPVKIHFCLNYQTKIEVPISEEDYKNSFNLIYSHQITTLDNISIEITKKYDDVDFYNIGDWRREQYDKNAKYTIWGETDCLIPEDYFYILSTVNISEVHIITLSSRYMWDITWDCVKHKKFSEPIYLDNQRPSHEELIPFRYYDVITQKELDTFNSNFDIEIHTINEVKIDGALLAISSGLAEKIIPDTMHFCMEDTVAASKLRYLKIPQYLISTRIKGHNYYHPNKRTNTVIDRTSTAYQKYADASLQEGLNFIKNFLFKI